MLSLSQILPRLLISCSSLVAQTSGGTPLGGTDPPPVPTSLKEGSSPPAAPASVRSPRHPVSPRPRQLSPPSGAQSVLRSPTNQGGAGDRALGYHYCQASFLVLFPAPFYARECPKCNACWLLLSAALSSRENEGFLKEVKLPGAFHRTSVDRTAGTIRMPLDLKQSSCTKTHYETCELAVKLK